MAGVRVIVPDQETFIDAAETDLLFAGLGTSPRTGDYRAFLVLDTGIGLATASLSIADAQFLRDGLDTILQRHRELTVSRN